VKNEAESGGRITPFSFGFSHHDVDRKCSTLPVLDNFHRHVAQLRIDSAPLAQRPPIVQVDLHWPLHKEYYGSGAEESAPAGNYCSVGRT
jgi:hypothetical protein